MTPSAGTAPPTSPEDTISGEHLPPTSPEEPSSGEDLPPAAHDAFDHGMRAYVAGQAEAAATAFEEALALAEELHEARYMLALARLQLGQQAAAVALLEAVAALPDHPLIADAARRRLALLATNQAKDTRAAEPVAAEPGAANRHGTRPNRSNATSSRKGTARARRLRIAQRRGTRGRG